MYINASDVGQLISARADYEPEKAGHRQIAFKLRVDSKFEPAGVGEILQHPFPQHLRSVLPAVLTPLRP